MSSTITRAGIFAAFVVMIVAASCHAETITLALPETEGGAKGSVDVVLKMQGARSVVAMQFVVVHDPAVLKIAKVEPAKLLEEASVENSFENPGRLWIASATLKPIAEDGDLLKITYDVLGEAGKKSPLTIEKAEAWQGNEMEVLVETKPGAVTVGAAKVGLNWLLPALIGLIVLGAVGFLLMRKKGSAPVPAAAAVPAPAHAPAHAANPGATPAAPRRPPPPPPKNRS